MKKLKKKRNIVEQEYDQRDSIFTKEIEMSYRHETNETCREKKKKKNSTAWV